MFTKLPLIKLLPVEPDNRNAPKTFKAPVYVTSARQASSECVFEVDLQTDIHQSLWILQGVAIILDIPE